MDISKYRLKPIAFDVTSFSKFHNPREFSKITKLSKNTAFAVLSKEQNMNILHRHSDWSDREIDISYDFSSVEFWLFAVDCCFRCDRFVCVCVCVNRCEFVVIHTNKRHVLCLPNNKFIDVIFR